MEKTREGSLVPFLFNDMIIEILSRLPVKSLLRFKCVSKLWNTLISEPYFVKLHLHRSSHNAEFSHHRLTHWIGVEPLSYFSLRSLLREDSPSPSPQERVPPFLRKNYHIVGSCNGLLCLAYFPIEDKAMGIILCFWNPALSLHTFESPILYISPAYYASGFGFGYDIVSETHKGVAFYLDGMESEKYTVKVFSPRESCWREIESLHATIISKLSGGVYLSGTLSWIAISHSTTLEGNLCRELSIVSLDLGNERWEQLSLPYGVDYGVVFGV